MKGLILSGGKGTRLRPITHTSAKQLVPVANKPILFYGIESIRNAGITNIGVVVGDTHQEIRTALGDGSAFGVSITYIPQSAPLGLAHAVQTAQTFLGDDSFVMYLGDNLIADGITPLVREFEAQRPNAQILLAHVKNPQEFGVAELDGERVVHLVEKPKQPQTDLALVGVYMFDPHIFEAVNAIQPSARGEYEITDAIQYLIDKGYHVASHIIEGYWKDTGRLEDMLEANRIVLETIHAHNDGSADSASLLSGKVIVGKGTYIVGSEVRGPVIIGENCHIENAYIGPFTAIADGVRIVGCEIEHSIIWENSTLSHLDSRVSDSLIGRNVVVSREERRPRVLRLLLGDNSQVGLL